MRGFWHIAWRAVFGKMHAQISVSSNLTWIAPSNALGCYCHTNLDASIPRTCKEASKFPCTVVPTSFHASTHAFPRVKEGDKLHACEMFLSEHDMNQSYVGRLCCDAMRFPAHRALWYNETEKHWSET